MRLSCWTVIQMRLTDCCGCIVLNWYPPCCTLHLNEIQTVMTEIKSLHLLLHLRLTLVFQFWGLCHPSSRLSLSSIVGNISHYNSSSRTGCHLGALCSVFVGYGSCFWELDREQAKGLFPSVQSLLQRDRDSAHRSLGTEREDRRCGWEGRT